MVTMSKQKFVGFSKILICLVSLILSFQAFANNNYELALRAYKQGDIDAAFIYLKNAFQEDDAHLPSKVLMGEVLLDKGFIREAIQEFEDALDKGVDPNLVVSSLSSSYIQTSNFDQLFMLSVDRLNDANATDLLLAKAHAYQAIGLLTKASETYEQLLTKSFQRLRVLSSQTMFFIQTNQLENAQNTLATVISEHPDSSVSHYLSAELNKREGNFTTALDEFEKAYKLNSNDPIIKRGYASELIRAQKFDAASTLVNEILAQTPSDPYALLFQARLLNIRSESKLATEAFDSITQNLSVFRDEFIEDNPSLQLIKGLSAYMSGNFELALSHLETYHSKVPNNKNAIAILANVYLNVGQNRRAQALLDRQYDLTSNDLNLGILLCELYLDNNKVFKCEQLRDLLKFRFPDARSLAIVDVKILQSKNRFEQALDLLKTEFDLETLSIENFLIYIKLLRKTNQQLAALEAIDKRLSNDSENLGLQAIKANLLVSTNRFEDAKKVNDLVISNNPNSYSAQLNEASVSIATGDLEKAKTILTTLVERFPREYQANFLLANTLLQEGNYKEAETKLTDMLAIFSNEPAPVELLVRHYLSTGDYDKALTMANKLNRDHFLQPAYIKLKADVHYALGQVDEASKQLKILFSLWQESAVELSSLARMQQDIGALEDAILSLQKSYALEPNDFVKRRILSLAIYANKQQLSQDTLIALKEKYPVDPSIAILEGDYLLAFSDNTSQAINSYKRALSLDPSNTLASAKLYSLALNQNLEFGFSALMESSLLIDSNLSFHRNLLADYLLSKGEIQLAKTHYENLLQNDAPNAAANANNLGNILLDEGLVEKARPLILRAYAALPNQAHVLNTYGRLMIQDGKFEQALGVLRQAYAKNSQSNSIKYHLAYTLHRLDRNIEAKQIIEQVDGKVDTSLSKNLQTLKNMI